MIKDYPNLFLLFEQPCFFILYLLKKLKGIPLDSEWFLGCCIVVSNKGGYSLVGRPSR